MRIPTAEDLKALGLSGIDPEALTVKIDPEDLREPDWSMGLERGIAHRKAVSARYWADDLSRPDREFVAALLEIHEHPKMRERRQAMRERL